MKIKYTLSQADIEAFNIATSSVYESDKLPRYLNNIYSTLYYVVPFMILMGIFEYFNYYGWSQFQSTSYVFLITAIWLIFLLISDKFLAKYSAQKHTNAFYKNVLEVSLDINDSSIKENINNQLFETNWKELIKILESREHFFLIFSSSKVIYIPRKALSETYEKQLIEILTDISKKGA